MTRNLHEIAQLPLVKNPEEAKTSEHDLPGDLADVIITINQLGSLIVEVYPDVPEKLLERFGVALERGKTLKNMC
jgi:hypothetical protein